jgi:hypothetical protein
VSLKLQSVFFFVPLCELDSLVGVVRQEYKGEPDSVGGISTEMLLIRGMAKGDEAAALLLADSRLVFSSGLLESEGILGGVGVGTFLPTPTPTSI